METSCLELLKISFLFNFLIVENKFSSTNPNILKQIYSDDKITLDANISLIFFPLVFLLIFLRRDLDLLKDLQFIYKIDRHMEGNRDISNSAGLREKKCRDWHYLQIVNY